MSGDPATPPGGPFPPLSPASPGDAPRLTFNLAGPGPGPGAEPPAPFRELAELNVQRRPGRWRNGEVPRELDIVDGSGQPLGRAYREGATFTQEVMMNAVITDAAQRPLYRLVQERDPSGGLIQRPPVRLTDPGGRFIADVVHSSGFKVRLALERDGAPRIGAEVPLGDYGGFTIERAGQPVASVTFFAPPILHPTEPSGMRVHFDTRPADPLERALVVALVVFLGLTRGCR
jgi:hypothetical protein